MGLVKEGVWSHPYESFTVNNVQGNIRAAENLQNLFGLSSLPDYFLESLLPTLRLNSQSIAFDYPYLDPQDPDKSDYGEPVYYPVRRPKEDEIAIREIGGIFNLPNRLVRAARGFGSLYFITEIDSEEYLNANSYPFRLDMRVANQIFSSFPKLAIEDGLEWASAVFNSWKHGSGEGNIYVPTDPPSLKRLEFRLERIDPAI